MYVNILLVDYPRL